MTTKQSLLPTLTEVRETFSLLEAWEDRYGYIVDLGRQVPEFPDALKTEEHRVRGCMSQVWVVPAPDKVPRFLAESDSQIVRGLIALTMVYVSENDDFTAQDLKAFLAQLGLDAHLSPNRRNGFAALANRLENMQ